MYSCTYMYLYMYNVQGSEFGQYVTHCVATCCVHVHLYRTKLLIKLPPTHRKCRIDNTNIVSDPHPTQHPIIRPDDPDCVS